MAGVSGINCLLNVNTGTTELPVYTPIGGQRNATLKMDGKEIDTTSKDGDGWESNVPGLRSWGMDCDGLYIDDSVNNIAAAKLEDDFIAGNQILVEMEMPTGKTYKGLATIVSLEIAGPHDKEMTSKISLKGSGALTPTAAV